MHYIVVYYGTVEYYNTVLYIEELFGTSRFKL
jgi:hypothetical protein